MNSTTMNTPCGRRKGEMGRFSLEPDEDMRWVYDPHHRDYHTEHARDLRARRADALNQVPKWMLQEAFENDERRKVANAEDPLERDERC